MVEVALPERGTTQEWALAYLLQGWSVIPIRPLEKRPLVAWEPYQKQRATLREIEGWITRWPDLNLGVVTGAISGIAVLDIDGQAGVDSLRQREQSSPPTLLAKTPHGWHAIYALNGHPVKTAAGIAPHVDTRGDGGYIVVAPSHLPDGQYIWHRRLPLAPVPEWMEQPERLHEPRPFVPLAGERWVTPALTQGVPEGQRNATAARLAGYLHAKGLPDDVVVTLLLPFAARCTPVMDERELGEIVHSVARYPQRSRSLDNCLAMET